MGKGREVLSLERNKDLRSDTHSTEAWVLPIIGYGAPCCLATVSRQMSSQDLSMFHMMGRVRNSNSTAQSMCSLDLYLTLPVSLTGPATGF